MAIINKKQCEERAYVELRVAQFVFNEKISRDEIPYFRAAVTKTAGLEWDLFHNHKNTGEEDQFFYRYPRIQYKRIRGHAAIVCIQEGTEEIHHFFSGKPQTLAIGNRKAVLQTEQIRADKYRIQLWEKYFTYKMADWLALNQVNYKKYNELQDKGEKLFFLEKILTGNILSFCKGIGLYVNREVKVNIEEVYGEGQVVFKDQKLSCFTIRFRTNIFLPHYLGLGKGTGLGFGVILPVAKQNADRLPHE